MYFFDVDPMSLPHDAQYYFDVTVINIAVRERLNGEFEDIWSLREVTSPRPIVLHIFKDDDSTFESNRNVEVEVIHHAILEVCGTEVSFWLSDTTEIDFDDEDLGDILELDDFWRF